MTKIFTFFLLLSSGVFAAVVVPNTDTLAYGSLKSELAIRAKDAETAYQSASVDLQKLQILHQKNTDLYKKNALSETEWKSSSQEVERTKTRMVLSEIMMKELQILSTISQMRSEWAAGAPEDIIQLSKLYKELWQIRVIREQESLKFATTEVEFQTYFYEVAKTLAKKQVKTDAELLEEKTKLEKANQDKTNHVLSLEEAEKAVKEFEAAYKKAGGK